jgi:hypothetical protein
MADQNTQNQNSQNPITGTLRTMKTDLDLGGASNPQDRLQQAGNFVQARPDVDVKPAPTPVTPVNPIPKPIPNSVPTPIPTDKKDIPATPNIPNTNSQPKPTYSWSNMNVSKSDVIKEDFIADTKKDIPNSIPPTPNKVDNKSGFSVLEDTIDLPLNNTPKEPNKINDNKSNSGVFKLEPNSGNSSVEFDLNAVNVQENSIPASIPPKSSMKSIISIVVVLVLLVLIGGGVYAFNMSRNNSTQVTDNNTDPNTNPTPAPTPESTPLLTGIPKADIAFVDTEPIRQTILSQLSSKKDSLIELNLTKNNNKVALTDIADVMVLVIPTDILSNLQDYWLYAYSQEGIYKLTAILELNKDKQAKELVDNWANSIPRDLSGFSINLPSRIVNTPTIKKNVITTSAGKTFDNNYYNYTSPADSIDVSSYENYILMASSQDSMRYLLNQIP